MTNILQEAKGQIKENGCFAVLKEPKSEWIIERKSIYKPVILKFL